MHNSNSQKLPVYHQHTSGISRALWPADMRRSLPTGRVAQKRRSMLMSGKWSARLANASQLGTSLALIMLSMFVGGAIVASLVLRLWYILLIPTAILTVITFVIAPPLWLKLNRTFRPFLPRSSREWRNLPFFPTPRRSPETPMPAPPLIRVLETVDLSHTNVEHFLNMTTHNESVDSATLQEQA
jgi:hypothetical protein